MDRDDNTLHQLEQELHVQIVPGTEVMVDVGSHHFVKSSGHSDRVLVPQPSDDAHDPLNWNRFWKFSVILCATAVTFIQGMGPLSLAPMFPELIKEFDSTLTDVVQFTGVAILVLGFSNFIWVPLSTSFGRRPVMLASTLICFCSAIWRARAQSYNSFMGACVLNGLAAGPAETLQPQIIADVVFLHDRGLYQTIYFACYFGSLMVGPIIAGAMTEYTGWRNFWWLNVGLFGAIFLLCLFGFPETKWHRLQHNELQEAVSESVAKLTEEKKPTEQLNEDEIERMRSKRTNELAHFTTGQRDPYLGKGTPSKQQFKLFQSNAHPLKSILLDLWIPWKLFAFPIVEFAAFVVSFSAAPFLAINLAQTQAFAAPPYNYSPLTIGFFNFAMLFGAIIGLLTNGPLSDWVSMKLTKRNRGVREPEMRLPTMIPYVLIMILGNFIVAFGWQDGWSWQVIVIIGWTCIGIQVAALPSIVSTYAVDSYKPVAGSIFVAITVNKNVYGYGLSKFITPWIIESGYVTPFLTNMTVVTLFCMFGILFWFAGKRFRVWTRDSKVHHVQ